MKSARAGPRQTQGLTERRSALGGLARSSLLEQPPEPVGVHAPGLDGEPVARWSGLQRGGSPTFRPGRFQALPEIGHQAVKRRLHRRWNGLAPEVVDEPLGRDDLADIQDQERQSARPRPPGRGTRRSPSSASSGPKIRNSTRAFPVALHADRTTADARSSRPRP